MSTKLSSAISSWQRWLNRPLFPVVVLAIFYGAMVLSVREKSLTFDEPGHAGAGVSYWKYNDYRFDPEGGNLPQRWIGLPLAIAGYPLPVGEFIWLNASTWTLSDQYFNRTGNDTVQMTLLGRAMAALIAVALGAVIWLWSRHLFGPFGAALSLLFYVLSPPVLANGPLMKDDISISLMFLAATGAFWAMLRKFTWTRIVVSGLVTGLLFVTKFSAVLMVPIAVVMSVYWFFEKPVAAAAEGGASLEVLTKKRKAQRLGIALLAQAVGIWLIVWATFGFRFSAFSSTAPVTGKFGAPWEWVFDQTHQVEMLRQLNLDAQQQAIVDRTLDDYGARFQPWPAQAIVVMQAISDRVLNPEQRAKLEEMRNAPPKRLMPRIIQFSLKHELLPSAYLFGIAHVWRTSGEKNAFLNGNFSDRGWYHYFPYVFAVKTPLAFLAVLILAAIIAARRWQILAGLVPLVSLFVVYWIFAVVGNINIGQRHIMPTYPPLFIFAGLLATCLIPGVGETATTGFSRLARWVVGLALAVSAVETACWFPNYLPYFNGIVQPSQAYRHLVDSSLDWGQDLPAAKHYIDTLKPDEKVFLAYFGGGSPSTFGIKANQFYGEVDFGPYSDPIIRVFPGVDVNKDREKVNEYLAANPELDPQVLLTGADQGKPVTVMVKQPQYIRIDPGTYIISATLMQPVRVRVFGHWTKEHEASYQRLSRIFEPLGSDDIPTRAKALGEIVVTEWRESYMYYRALRFERLAAFLRRREPDRQLNHSLMVYRLTAADLETALHGPAPSN